MSVKSEYNISTQSIILDALRLLNINNVDAEKTVKIYNKYLNVKSLSSCYRSTIRELGLLLPIIDIERYVDYILGSLNADTLYDLRYDALYMAKCLKDANAINSKNPAGVAAAIVCLAISKRDPVNAGRYIRDVALLAGVSIVTLKKRIKELNTILS